MCRVCFVFITHSTMSTFSFLFFFFFFFFNDTATTEIYTLSLHDALPILRDGRKVWVIGEGRVDDMTTHPATRARSEEHTSELQSQSNLVCRLLLEKKKNKKVIIKSKRTL